MKNSARDLKLNSEQCADLFLQLAQLEKAGICAEIAFGLLADNDKSLKNQLYAVQKLLKSGQAVADAGYKMGLFTAMQRAMLSAAESSGTLITVYQELADYYAARAKRLRKIKSRCYYPAILLTISLFLQPLPGLISGSLTGLAYLQLSVGRLMSIIFIIYLALGLPSLLNTFGLAFVAHRLQLQLPGVAQWIIKRQLNHFYLNLALLLGAGLSYAQALPLAVASIPNSVLRSQFKPALSSANLGKSVADNLALVESIQHTQVIQMIGSLEYGGRLAQGLHHFAQLAADDLHLQDDMLAEWLPRLVYTAVVVWIAKSLIGF